MKHLNINLQRHNGRYRTTTDFFFFHFMHVVCNTVIKIAFSSYENFILLFGHINISNCTIGLDFFFLSFDLWIQSRHFFPPSVRSIFSLYYNMWSITLNYILQVCNYVVADSSEKATMLTIMQSNIHNKTTLQLKYSIVFNTADW